MKVFRNGLMAGMILQFSVGPVFFFVMNTALQGELSDGLAAVVGVMLADYVYITLALFGVGKMLEKKSIKKWFVAASSAVLIAFGVLLIKSASVDGASSVLVTVADVRRSFVTAFLLTMSSPLTILFWTGLFAAKALEYDYSKKELVVFGFSAGLATFIFLGLMASVLSFVKGSIPSSIFIASNMAVGCLLVIYGGVRLKSLIPSAVHSQ